VLAKILRFGDETFSPYHQTFTLSCCTMLSGLRSALL
jgi:hypothetical protein